MKIPDEVPYPTFGFSATAQPRVERRNVYPTRPVSERKEPFSFERDLMPVLLMVGWVIILIAMSF